MCCGFCDQGKRLSVHAACTDNLECSLDPGEDTDLMDSPTHSDPALGCLWRSTVVELMEFDMDWQALMGRFKAAQAESYQNP